MIPRTLKLSAGLALCFAVTLASAEAKAQVPAQRAGTAADRDFYWYFYPIDSTGIAQDTDGMTTGAAKLRYDSKGRPKVAYGRGSDVYYA